MRGGARYPVPAERGQGAELPFHVDVVVVMRRGGGCSVDGLDDGWAVKVAGTLARREFYQLRLFCPGVSTVVEELSVLFDWNFFKRQGAITRLRT